jgi:ubiquinone/menaquinone biosynthesis C-methylase UbiE
VPIDIAAAWDRFAAEYQRNAGLGTAAAHYGPDIPDESVLHLLGDLKGKRVLELGCGAAQCSIAFAKAGATAVGVDVSAAQLAYGRHLCEEHEVKVELRLGDMADLAFLRADSIDLAFSSYAFQYVQDLNRVFRQVHRVLKVGAPLVFSLPHPAYTPVEPAGADPLTIKRTYFDHSAYRNNHAGPELGAYQHTFADIYMGLARASYRVDLVLEPEPARGAPRSWFWDETMEWLPRTLIVRARKEGS